MEMNARRPRRSRRDLEKQEQDHLKWIADLQATDQTLRARVAELEAQLRGATRLADEVAVLVRTGKLDARSPGADALLDFRSPPSTPRADRLAELELREIGAASNALELEKARDTAQRRAASLQAEVAAARDDSAVWQRRAEQFERERNDAQQALAESERKRAELATELAEVTDELDDMKRGKWDE